MEIRLIFFKDTGAYHAEEIVEIPDASMSVFQINIWLQENIKSYKCMHAFSGHAERAGAWLSCHDPDRKKVIKWIGIISILVMCLRRKFRRPSRILNGKLCGSRSRALTSG